MADPILGEQQFIPNALTPNYRTRFYRDPVSGALSVQYTIDGGITWNQFVSQVPSGVAANWVAVTDGNGGIVWKPILSFVAPVTVSTSGTTTQSWADFSYPGSLALNGQFGYFKVPSQTTLSCYGAQASIFSPSSGSGTTISVVNIVNGIPQTRGASLILNAGALFTGATFSQAVAMAPNSEWALSLSSVGSTEPGEFLSCRLLFTSSSS